MKLAEGRAVEWRDRRHFFAVAAQMMRRVLVDHERERSSRKRDGNRLTFALNESIARPQGRGVDLAALDDALNGAP